MRKKKRTSFNVSDLKEEIEELDQTNNEIEQENETKKSYRG